MYMSAYIPPVLNNGVLNSTFNSADFESTYPDSFLPLSGGNIRGSLGVSGVIDADNDLMISGNLGIGTTSPQSTLDMSGDLVVRTSSSGLKIGNVTSSDYPGIMNSDLTANTSYALLQKNTGETYVNAAPGKNINFSINNDLKMFVASNGYVGVDQSSPAALLSVGSGSQEIPFAKGSYNSSYPPLLNVRHESYSDDASIAHFARGNSIFQIQAGGIYHKRGTGDVMELKTSSGHVFIGNGTQNKYIRFATNGTIAPSTSFSSAYSDDRIKFNEKDVSNCLNIIRKLSSPQKYERFMPKEENDQIQTFPTDASWNEVKNNDDINYYEEIGFIAQDIQQIPELAFSVRGEEYDAIGNATPLLLDYGNIHNVTTGAVRELDAIVQQQQRIITALEARIIALENTAV